MSKTSTFQRLLLASAATVLFAGVAQAGFEWKGPATAPLPAAAPASPTSEGYPEPVIMWDGASSMPAQKVGAVESAPVGPVELSPSSSALVPNVAPQQGTIASPQISVASQPLVPPPSAIHAASALADSGETVVGFGSDLPLAIALQQIVPAGFQFAFGVGVNPGTSVSWEGGKPWKTVLSETLAPKGYGFVIDNNVVKVVEHGGAPAPAHIAPMPLPVSDVAPANDLPNVTGIEPMAVAPAASSSNVVSVQGADAAAMMKAPADPVNIRRQKPSLLSRAKNLGNRLGGETGQTVPEETAPKSNVKKSPDTNAPEVLPRVKNTVVEKESVTITETKTEVKPPASAPAAMPEVSKDIQWSEAPAVSDTAPMNITRNAEMTSAPAAPLLPPAMDAPALDAPMMDTPAMISPVPAPKAPTPPPVTSGINMASDTAPAATLAPATWHGARGQTLRDVLKSWSDVAGVELYWAIDYDFRLQKDVGYPGSYDEAVGNLLDLFAGVRPQPYGQLHQENGNGQRVLVIKSYDTTQ